MVRLAELPISEDTRDATRAWARRWEELAWQWMDDYDVQSASRPGRAEAVPTSAWFDVEQEQEQLCQRLREELGPPWRVALVSFDDDSPPDERMRVQWERGGPVTPL
jgi:hypothetical protein